MDSQAKSQLIQILICTLVPILIAIVGLIIYLVYIHQKEKKKDKKPSDKTEKKNVLPEDMQSIFKFMEFDTVRDNMIVQKKGLRYLMVIECQGINYDLMSTLEKNGVEEGFVQFLNTLRHKIQIYIQTRSVNLESSLQVYRERVEQVESKLNQIRIQYENMKESGEYTDEQISKVFYELTKQSNLYEYGKSVLQDTEKMSLNKNILNRKYYIIVPYYSEEAGNDKLDIRELDGIAFSELYTRSQSIVRSISTCGVRGKILKSNELIELLYMAYNRDEAETFGLDKALRAGFNEMYTTAPDVLRKKMNELDRIIEEKAIEKARSKVDEVQFELQREVEEKEDNIDDLISEMAKLILDENEQYLGKEVKNRATEKIDNEKTKAKKGGKQDGQKTTRTRKTTTV